jgi:AcrR family transcriptional regulator
MARPVSIDERALLAAARSVFLERGYSATTAEVAERAGVSEGTLFHRYGTKKALFAAAMAFGLAGLLSKLDLKGAGGAPELEAKLVEVVVNLVEFLREMMPAMMMSWSNRAESGIPEGLDVPDPPPLRLQRALSGFFAGEVREGRLRAADPDVLARLIMGGAMEYVFLEMLGKAQGIPATPLGTYAHGLVDVLLRGAAVTPPPPPQIKQRRSKKG